MRGGVLNQRKRLVPLVGILVLVLPAAQATAVRPLSEVSPPRFRPLQSVTPGKRDPNITPSNIHSTVCIAGYSSAHRPPTSLTNKLKKKVAAKVACEGPSERSLRTGTRRGGTTVSRRGDSSIHADTCCGRTPHGRQSVKPAVARSRVRPASSATQALRPRTPRDSGRDRYEGRATLCYSLERSSRGCFARRSVLASGARPRSR